MQREQAHLRQFTWRGPMDDDTDGVSDWIRVKDSVELRNRLEFFFISEKNDNILIIVVRNREAPEGELVRNNVVKLKDFLVT